jgi:uncharacterized protein (UPF0548 family)
MSGRPGIRSQLAKLAGRPSIERRLSALAGTPVNYDADALDLGRPPPGWNVDRRCQALPGEPPGAPVAEGSWEIACRLIRGYEFADPSVVRAHYDPERPLEGRDMLLELRALGVVRTYVGVRVVRVYNERRTLEGRAARVFGWAYRTLEGHVEEGQMDWQVWKWLDTGDVQFRVHAVSRTAPIPNVIVRIGFWALRDHERAVFLDSTERRMRGLTERALPRERRGEQVRLASTDLTARRLGGDDPAHDRLARDVERPHPAGADGGPVGNHQAR